MYLKEFDIRWSDVDANHHLANSAYLNFMTHTRMALLGELGFDQKVLAENQIGPVVFYEHMYYFKEVLPGRPIKVSLEVTGLSDDGKFFEFRHNFYNAKGRNVAQCDMMGAWMSLESRRLVGLPVNLLANFKAVEKPEGFRVLTKEDTRKYVRIQKDLAV